MSLRIEISDTAGARGRRMSLALEDIAGCAGNF